MRLRKQIVPDMFAPEGDHRIHWWEPPSVPDFASPADLAALLISYRDRVAEIRRDTGRSVDFFGDLSAGALGSLLRYAYRASFTTDEGRSVRARFFVKNAESTPDRDEEGVGEVLRPLFQERAQVWEQKTHVHRFVNAIGLENEKTVARLAPTLIGDDAVLLVREVDAQPKLVGIGLLNHNDWERQILRLPREGNGSGGLLVEILGPGHVHVAEGSNQYTLRANELILRQRSWGLVPVRDWLAYVSARLTAKVSSDGDWSEEDKHHCDIGSEIEGWPQIDVMITWSRILREALRLRHGGAFVVLPDVHTDLIRMRFPTAPLPIGDEIVSAWQALRQLWRYTPEDDVLRLAADKQSAVHHLLSTTRSVSALSATDGCVVFDRTMTMHGFGGSIGIPSDRHTRRKKIWHLQDDKEVSPGELFASLGERHKSAFELCEAVPNAIAFVVSQDGDLRVFCSDENQVQFADRLFP